MRAKVPAHVAQRWQEARRLRKIEQNVRNQLVGGWAVWLAAGDVYDKELIQPGDEHYEFNFVMCNHRIDQAVHELLEALEERARELECPCDKKEDRS